MKTIMGYSRGLSQAEVGGFKDIICLSLSGCYRDWNLLKGEAGILKK
jgi:hypothetical protein